MTPMTMKPTRTFVLTLTLACALGLALALPAMAHQCVDVEITSAPGSGAAGGTIAVAGTLENCGDPASAFTVSWTLIGDEGRRRITLLEKLVTADPGATVSFTETLSIPSTVPAGNYTLVLKGVAPSSFTDTDSTPLTVT